MGSALSVLLVEDSPCDAELIVARLREWGYAPEWVRVGDAKAMRIALASRSWDVVISDWSLPGFSGLEALAILQERKVDVPFIIASGVVDDDLAVHAMRRGAHDYVCKDNMARLGAAIEREIAQARLRAERAKQHEEAERFFNVTPDLFCVCGFRWLGSIERHD